MFSNYAAKLSMKLIENQFEPINGFLDNNEITKETRAFAFIKHDSATWYAVTIINTSVVGIEEYKDSLSKDLDKFYERIVTENSKNNIIAVNLLVSEEFSSFTEFMEEDNFSYDAKVINVFWEAELCNASLRVAKNNPDKILNLYSIVSDCLNDADVYNGSFNINDIYLLAREGRPRLKSVKKDAPFASYSMIAINLLITAVIFLQREKMFYTFLEYGALVPELIFQGEYYRLFTSMFLHIDYFHVISNCLSLYIFGSRVERYYGSFKFLLIYFLSGLAGGVFSILVSDAVSVGASGAVFGLMGAVLALTFKSKANVGGLNYTIMILLALTSFGMGLVREGVNNYGHFGGLVCGIVLGFVLYNANNKRTAKDGH